MKKAISMIFAAIFVLSFFAMASADDVTTKFYGYQWLRYDYNVMGGSYGDSTKSNNEFTVPRTYLRWKMSDDEAGIEGNITMDINNTNSGEGVSGVAVAGSIDWASWLKKASVDFTKVPYLSDIDMTVRVGQQDVYFGYIDLWSYPVISLGFDDKNKVVPSVDDGIAVTGKLPEGYGDYELAMYNGTGYKDVPNDGTSNGANTTDKAYDACLMITPISGLWARASYYHKISSVFGVSPAQAYNATAVVLGGATGPINGFVEYTTSNNAANYAAGSKSGVSEGVSGFIGIDLTSMISLNARVDTWNPDTKVVRDEVNMYTAGVNIKFSDKVLLQLDYQLDQNRYPAGGAKDNNLTNNNQWLSQLVWNW